MTTSYSQPLITTVIPTYRRPLMLRRAIRSVLAQTYPHFRVCVYDNASGDETGAVVEEFRRNDPRVEYVCRPNNIGMFANFMDGANRVETPYFSFLSDDDLMLPEFYERALEGFRHYPEAGLSTLATLRMQPSGVFVNAPILHWPEGLIPPPDGVLSILQYGDPGLQSLLIPKKIWTEFGPFDESTEPSSDVDFQLRVTTRLPIVVSRHIGAIGVLHSGSVTVKAEAASVWSGWPLTCQLADKFNRDTSLSPEARQRAAAILADRKKRILLTQGILKSISHGKWQDAKLAADLLVQECQQSRAAVVIQRVVAASRKWTVIPVLLRLCFGMRAAQKALLGLDARRRFRSYSRFLRMATAAASTASLPSIATRAGEDGGAAVPREMSAG